MSNVPPELKYTKTHEWARYQPTGLVEFGITDHAQESLGDLVSLDVPGRGRQVAAGESCASVESVKAVSDVHSPVGGEIAEINGQLSSTPELVNQDPYGKGWIARVRPKDGAWDAQLLSASDYEKLVEAEPA